VLEQAAADAASPTDIDPCGQRAFLRVQHLERLLPEGGAKLKFVLGAPGAGKTHFLRQLAGTAGGLGYLVAAIDATRDPLWGFDHLYRAAVGGCDLPALGRAFAVRMCADLGYEGVVLDEATDLAAWARAAGHAEAPLRVRVDEALHARLIANPDLDRGYATGLVRWLQRLLWGGGDDLLLMDAWVRGSRVSARECNRLRVRRPVDRYTGRLWLRSFLQFARAAGRPGLLVAVDRLETILSPTAPPALEPALLLRYTRQRRDDLFECLRAIVDDVAALPGLLLVLAGPPEILSHGKYGVASYPALALRVQNEVATAEINRFADEIVLERLWTASPSARSELATAWLCRVRPDAPEGLRTMAMAAAEAEWRAARDASISPVKRSIEAVLEVAARGQGGGAA